MSEKFEKARITYWNGADYVPGIIAGHDFNLGITAVRKDDYKKMLFCLHGPASPINIKWDEKAYEKIFNKITEAIKDGAIRCYELDEWLSKYATRATGNYPDIKNCPFNQ